MSPLRKEVKKNKETLIYFILGIALVILIIGSSLVFSSQTKKIFISGSSTVYPVVEQAAKNFMEAHPSFKISVEKTGSGVGINSLIEGKSDVALSSREINSEEIISAAENDRDIESVFVGMDAIAIIAHKDNPVNNLSHSQIQSIFFDTNNPTSKWNELGISNQAEINVYGSDPGKSGTGAFFAETINPKGLKLKYQTVFPSSDLAGKVASDINAIGFLSYKYAAHNPDLKIINFNGVAPDKDTISNLDYFLSRFLFVVYPRETQKQIKDFIDYILSPEGQKIVEEVGLVSINSNER